MFLVHRWIEIDVSMVQSGADDSSCNRGVCSTKQLIFLFTGLRLFPKAKIKEEIVSVSLVRHLITC